MLVFSRAPVFCVNPQPVNACTLAYVEDGTTLIGFDVDDVCLENTEWGWDSFVSIRLLSTLVDGAASPSLNMASML